MRCIIIDDEYPARILLKDFVEKVPTLELAGSFKSALEALPVLQAGDVDLMFLDIQMPDITGVNFLKMLPNKPFVVFTTAYSEYAIESYQLDVLDYLLKPFSFDRFLQAVGKAMNRKKQEGGNNETVEARREVVEDNKEQVLLVKADHKIHRVRLDDIVYVEGLREYVTLFLRGKEKIITLESLRKLEETLPSSMFVRIHKSYIVRISLIRALYGNMVKVDGVDDYLPIGKSYKDEVQKMLFE